MPRSGVLIAGEYCYKSPKRFLLFGPLSRIEEMAYCIFLVLIYWFRAYDMFC